MPKLVFRRATSRVDKLICVPYRMCLCIHYHSEIKRLLGKAMPEYDTRKLKTVKTASKKSESASFLDMYLTEYRVQKSQILSELQ